MKFNLKKHSSDFNNNNNVNKWLMIDTTKKTGFNETRQFKKKFQSEIIRYT